VSPINNAIVVPAHLDWSTIKSNTLKNLKTAANGFAVFLTDGGKPQWPISLEVCAQQAVQAWLGGTEPQGFQTLYMNGSVLNWKTTINPTLR